MVRFIKKILYMNPVTGPSVMFLDLAGNILFDGSEEDGEAWYDPAVDVIVDTITTAFEELGDAASAIASEIGGIGSDIGSGILSLIRGAGIAVVEGMEDVYLYLGGKIGGKKVQLTSAVTSLVIIGFTVAYIFARIPSGGDSE